MIFNKIYDGNSIYDSCRRDKYMEFRGEKISFLISERSHNIFQ